MASWVKIENGQVTEASFDTSETFKGITRGEVANLPFTYSELSNNEKGKGRWKNDGGIIYIGTVHTHILDNGPSGMNKSIDEDTSGEKGDKGLLLETNLPVYVIGPKTIQVGVETNGNVRIKSVDNTDNIGDDCLKNKEDVH